MLVSPLLRTPENNYGPYVQQAYTLAVNPEEQADQAEEIITPGSVDLIQETERLELQEMLGTTIISARNLSQRLDPPLPMENYSPLSKLGATIILQLLEKYKKEWEKFNRDKWGKMPPITQARDTDI